VSALQDPTGRHTGRPPTHVHVGADLCVRPIHDVGADLRVRPIHDVGADLRVRPESQTCPVPKNLEWGMSHCGIGCLCHGEEGLYTSVIVRSVKLFR